MLTETQCAPDGTGNTSTEKNHNYHCFEREAIKGSPFTYIWEEGKGWYMVMGDYRMTEEFEEKNELEEFIKENMWNLILVMSSIIASKHIEENNKLQTYNKIQGEDN